MKTTITLDRTAFVDALLRAEAAAQAALNEAGFAHARSRQACEEAQRAIKAVADLREQVVAALRETPEGA